MINPYHHQGRLEVLPLYQEDLKKVLVVTVAVEQGHSCHPTSQLNHTAQLEALIAAIITAKVLTC